MRCVVQVWDRGIKGENQLVGVSDSGFDLTNCLLANSDSGDGFGTLQVRRRRDVIVTSTLAGVT